MLVAELCQSSFLMRKEPRLRLVDIQSDTDIAGNVAESADVVFVKTVGHD